MPFNLEHYRHAGIPRLKLYAGLYMTLWLSALYRRNQPNNLGVSQTLKQSSFARTMFMDVGALSTLGAVYLCLTGKTPVRIPAAIASLFVGSFALIPALAWEDWGAMQEEKKN